MKIAVFTENMLMQGSGGAEVYALKLAEVLSTVCAYDVTVFTVCNEESEKDYNKIYKKYDVQPLPVRSIYLKHVKNQLLDIPNRIFFWFKLRNQVAKHFDVFINCTHNRLIGFRNIFSVHLVHFPIKNYAKILPFPFGKIMNKVYRNSYKLFLSNSCFTQYHLKKEWNVDSIVLNPPINMQAVSKNLLKNKEKIILMVGRLVPDKRFLEMVLFYESVMNEPLFQDFKLVIIGNKDKNCADFYEELLSHVKKNKIEIYSDVSFSSLIEWYKKSFIFLHAKGYLESDDNPIMMEHFGMTTVEAMANGCIPIVINKAGQKEIVENGTCGFLWNSEKELKDDLCHVLSDISLSSSLQINAVERSKYFLMESFKNNVKAIFTHI